MYSGYLQLHLARGVGEATIQRLLMRLDQKGVKLNDFLNYSIKDTLEFGISIEQAKAIFNAQNILEDVYKELEKQQTKLIPMTSPLYPLKLKKRLGSKSPYLLYAWGNIELLARKMVGFCGSRNVSAKGIEVAKDCAEQVSSWVWTTVSGGARGVDATVHSTTLKSQGSTIVVLPEGILKYKAHPDLATFINKENTLFLSQFPPKMPWSIANAMQRNKVICGLSEALIVIESGMKGGTFEAGSEAIRLKLPLFVADYATPSDSAKGNAYFLSKGAHALRRKGETGKASLESLKNLVENQKEIEAVQEKLL